MAGFGQYIQNLRQFQDLSDMGMNNIGIPNMWQQNFRNINPVDYFSVQQLQQQQLECPTASYSCDHNYYLSTSAPGDTGVATNNEESVTTTSIMCSKNCSSASTSEIGGDMINKKNKNRIGKGKKGRSMNGRLEEVIHVRAKRGEATDSHSIAERARREKINKKMRCLQDLVPGCHKTMGMAGMLEEIINYVHSLQNQVEFLSMELAAACSNKKAQGTNNSQETTTEMEKWARARAREQYGDYYTCFPSTWSL